MSTPISEDTSTKNTELKEDDPKKEDCILDHMEISIAESEKRTNTSINIRDFYTVYLIETKVFDNDWLQIPKDNKTSIVWRRYSEFEHVRNHLQSTYPYIILPPLPEKKPMFIWRSDTSNSDITDPDFVDRRRACLENYIHRISSHSTLGYDKLFMSFLRQESGWKETYKHSISSTNTNNNISKYFNTTTNQMFKLKYPNRHIDKIKIYSENLEKNMNNILRIRCKMAQKLYSIHKLHEHYGKVLCEWSAIEKEMGDGLQQAGHYFDSIAEFIVPALEDEEVIADQLKEYLFFADSLNSVYKEYELCQHALELNQDALYQKNNEKLRLQEGKTNLFYKIFGSIDTEDIRDIKVQQCDNKIQQLEDEIEQNKNNVNTFTANVLNEYKKFEDQKNEDMKQTLKNYATLQVRINKKALNTWQNIRACIESIP